MEGQTRKKEIRHFESVLSLESLFPSSVRDIFELVFFWIGVLSGISYLLAYLSFGNIGVGSFLSRLGVLETLTSNLDTSLDLFFLFLSLWLFMMMLSAFHNSYQFESLETVVHEGGIGKKTGLTYEVAKILRFQRKTGDLTKGFLLSPYGHELVRRLAVSEVSVKEFLKTKTNTIQEPMPLEVGKILTLADIASYIFEKDSAYQDFLFKEGITRDMHHGGALWVMRILHSKKHEDRWWSRDNLGAIPGIGKDWSYGGAYTLERYTKNSLKNKVFSSGEGEVFTRGHVYELEKVLIRGKEANALLVGEDGGGKSDVLARLSQKIQDGKAFPQISHYNLIVFDDESFIADHSSKATFEQAFIKMLKEADKSGNIILVLEDLPGFIRSTQSLGSDIISLLDQYLTSPNLHIVGTATPGSFHEVLENNSQLIQRFEKVQVEDSTVSRTVEVLEEVAIDYEHSHNVLFSYQAIRAISEGADRYITHGVMPDKAVDLLVEILSSVPTGTGHVVTALEVGDFLGQKTGIPTGAVGGVEKEKLLNLEKILHERIVGQNEAINAISSAMRRARAGIQNPNRPLGSFLFLGPTGVGKTETAKGLARVFFGDEDQMLRLDMSEYNSHEALTRLIGSFDSDRAGSLSKLLKDKPYGVLLLDEFEKAASEVKDLFLQVLDEGYFSDMRGKRINARNLLIVATSNAGANLIWDLVKEGKDVSQEKETIVDTIVHDGTYKPELINRFDAVVVFHPLNEEHLREIARILLGIFARRIKEKGYTLVVNDALVDVMVRKGYDPQFGARPMNRALQEHIEEKVAQKIIQGDLKKGDSIEFSESDFS